MLAHGNNYPVSMKKLFGTDGIRGVAGQPPLDPATIHAIGLAIAHHLGNAIERLGVPATS